MASSIGLTSMSLRAVSLTASLYPRFILLSPSPQCYRAFSQSQASKAKGIPQSLSVKRPAEPSMQSRYRDQFRDRRGMEIPQDIGILPGTFVRPEGEDLPSIFQQPRERLRMEWVWLKSWAQNVVGVVAYSKYFNKGLPLRLRERRRMAGELHRQLYTALAAGEKDTIGKIACAGLANNLISRIRRRPSNQKVTWTLDKYIRGPSSYFTGIRVVSDRATEIPEIQDCGIRQVVVRITSRQTTVTEQVSETRKGKQAVDEEPKVKTQDCTEYLVLQKMLWMGEEQDWRVWGYATPTTVADLDSPWFASGLSLSERLKLMEQTLRK